MALGKNIVLNNGLKVEGAYIRIDAISGNKDKLDISVNSYISKEKFNEGVGYLEQKQFIFKPSVEDNSFNFIKQGYEYLKTLEEYENAIDLLD